jgi:hypothetical protein
VPAKASLPEEAIFNQNKAAANRRRAARKAQHKQREIAKRDLNNNRIKRLLTVYFGAPSMFITLWFGFDYGTNPPLGTLII